MPLNDCDLSRFDAPEYSDIKTGSWLDWRSNDPRPETVTDFHGLFISQIPRLLIQRYTNPGAWVLDPMCGGGTTAVECAYLGRRTSNIDLRTDLAERAQGAWRKAWRAQPGNQGAPGDDDGRFWVGNASTVDYEEFPRPSLIIWHPPYHNIIRFSDDPADFSTCRDEDEFLGCLFGMAGVLLRHILPGGHLALVMGDTYHDGQWRLLSAFSAAAVQEAGWILKADHVKRTLETTAKRNQKSLWRWRHLAHGTTEFEHEHVYVFRRK